MARKIRIDFLYVVVSIVFCASIYHHFLRDPITAFSSAQLPLSPTVIPSSDANHAVIENLTTAAFPPSTAILDNFTTAAALPPSSTMPANLTDVAAPPYTVPDEEAPPPISTTSVLLPAWEVLVIVSPETTPLNVDGYVCLFETNEISPARFSGVLPFPDRTTFVCQLPVRARRPLPFKQPVLLRPPENPPTTGSPPGHPPLLRWSYLVYDSLTTEDDVVLFVKGVNTRQGINRKPSELRCVFGDDVINGVRTAVTASMQEVFRCQLPDATAVSLGAERPVKISLEIATENQVVPSVAYYTPPRRIESKNGKSLLCATTMVYDVAKFLKEWVLYHSKIGVEKFLLYDNGSDDDLGKVVDELVKQGFNISTYFWLWPKTQEAGFSHSAIYARGACTWMMYVDVDEFVYSPSWNSLSQPSESSLLHSLVLPISKKLGQVSINCLEFGPSGQKVHPTMGVTQGYNCRRREENRHKSILLLDAVNDSLLNVIHHFDLKPGYKTRKLRTGDIVVNHYKYQAWPEFKVKFRRRVSAYVLDWTQRLNPKSNDRAPGLGFEPVEPEGWPDKFCQVYDSRLKDLTLQWFGKKSDSGYQMSWQC